MFDEIQKLYEPYGSFDKRALESLKIALGDKHMPDSKLDYETMKSTLLSVNAVECFEVNLKPTEKDSTKCMYKWVSTGLTNEYGKNIYLAFTRSKEKGVFLTSFWCYFVGTYERLEQNAKKHIADIKGVVYDASDSVKSAISRLDGIDKKILLAMGKNYENMSKSEFAVIDKYLIAVEGKIKNEVQNNVVQNYKKNKEGNYICYKLALRDFKGRDILIYQKMVGNAIYETEIVKSKEQLIGLGFDESILDLPPVRFHKNVEELVVMPSFSQFDLENAANINHIFCERAERFPVDISDMDMTEKYMLLEENIKFNTSQCQRDYKWMVPFYEKKKDKITYLLPFYLGRKKGGPAELALVVAKDNYYVPVTVFTIEMARENATVMSETLPVWLKKGE